jgi:pantetheine-phosphate adenylyltransferase
MDKPHITAQYNERALELKKFLKIKGKNKKVEIIPLSNSFGNTTTDSTIEALVVSEETKNVAFKINEIRHKLGLPPVEIVIIQMFPAENKKPISTTRIRDGEIDKEGHILKK